MDWRAQEWKRVADHGAAKRRIVSGKFLVPVSSQPFIATDLEHHLRRRCTEERAGLPAREPLKQPDRAPLRPAKHEYVPAAANVLAVNADINLATRFDGHV